MTSPHWTEAYAWFKTLAPDAYFEQLITQHQLPCRKRVYWLGLVIWLMLYQRLCGDASLTVAVLAVWFQRRAGKPVSARTGGYCQARQRLPTLVVKQVSDELFEKLRGAAGPHPSEPVFVVDGTTLRLEHERELAQAFPPGHNQHGENHWPMLRVVVFHDAHNGLAARPSWGPLNGPQAASEQALAEQGLERLPAGAVVLGDANFGIFAFAHAVAHSGRDVLLRLTEARAAKILGELPAGGLHRPVTWTVSRWDRRAHPELDETACLPGWILVCPHPLRRSQRLYLFTTLERSTAQLLALYKLRWNVESDLRSLKRTVALHRIRGRSVALVENELLLAVSAYNLVRLVMLRAAQRAGIPPRQFSFAHVLEAVLVALPALERARTRQEAGPLLRDLIELATQLRLPRRKRKRRSYQRKVWGRGASFPLRPQVPREGNL